MRVAVAGRRWWLGGGLVLGACSALAQVPSWPAATFPDPLRFSSLPLNAAEATAPPPGRWQVMSTTGYFNVWQLTWHTGTIHKGWGLLGTPLTSPEVENLAVAFPQDQFFHVDIEGVRSDLLAAYGLPHGLAVVLQVPWNNQKDQQINARAVPTLNSEAVKAQSADIDMVSGATYTSEAYLQSLQSAIDRAHLS